MATPGWSADGDVFVPRRRRGFEHLDDPRTSAELRQRSLRDVRRANILLGGSRAVLRELERCSPPRGGAMTLLDVGTGLADIPVRARRAAARRGVSLVAFGVDGAEVLARASRDMLEGSTCADARRLPFADDSVDVVICSQVLHHFEESEIPVILRELTRVARLSVIVSDLRRSWLAAAGFWLVSWPLNFHDVSRHDGFTSVLRGFTSAELACHAREATGCTPHVRRHPGFRLTATWSPHA